MIYLPLYLSPKSWTSLSFYICISVWSVCQSVEACFHHFDHPFCTVTVCVAYVCQSMSFYLGLQIICYPACLLGSHKTALFWNQSLHVILWSKLVCLTCDACCLNQLQLFHLQAALDMFSHSLSFRKEETALECPFLQEFITCNIWPYFPGYVLSKHGYFKEAFHNLFTVGKSLK